MTIITETMETVKTEIRYNRIKKTWQTVNGRVTSHPTRHEALLAALRHDHPAIYRVVIDLARLDNFRPEVTSRLIKAAQLVTHGLVYDGEVRSQTDDGTYYCVDFAGIPAKYSCTCQDWQGGRAPIMADGRMCKHAMAQHIAYLANIPTEAPPIPFDGQATNIIDWDSIYDGVNPPGYNVNEEIAF